jgi:hypothetical protein
MANSQKNNRITPFAVTDYRDIRKLFGNQDPAPLSFIAKIMSSIRKRRP